MASIKLLDSASLDVSIAGADGNSSLAKYLWNDLKFVFDRPTFANNQTLALSRIGEENLPFTLSAKLSSSFGFGGAASLTVKEGLSARIAICKDKDSADLLSCFDKKPVSPPVYLSFQTGANVETAAQGTVNEFTFGMAVGDEIQITNYCSCDPGMPLLDATKAAIANFTLPVAVEDLLVMSPGTVFEVEGKGTLTFSAAVGYQFLNNPLATIKTPFIKAPTINACGSANLKFSVGVFGGFKVSVLKDANNTVLLAVGRSRGQKFAVDFKVKAGLELQAVGTDLLGVVLGQISPDPKQIEKLRQLPAENRTAIEKALKEALESNFAAGVAAEFSRETENDVLFLYELDLNKLQENSKRAAVKAALRGDYSLLALLAAVPESGVIEKTAVHGHSQKVTRSLTIHLLNIFQFTDVSSLILNGKVQVSPDSGALVITDTATADQIRATTGSLYADSKKLRALLFTSSMVSAAYQGTNALVGAPSLSFRFEFFSMHAATPNDVMRHELTALSTIGAISQPRMNSILGNGSGNFGSTNLNLAIRLDPLNSGRLFLANGKAFPIEHYEAIGKKAMLTLLQNDSGLTSQARLSQLKDDAFTRITDILNKEGNSGFNTAFGDLPLAIRTDILGDHEVIVWWAEAMAAFAGALQSIQAEVKQAGGFNPASDAFKKLERDFERKAADVVSTTKDRFDLPWSALAIYFALLPEIKVEASFTSAALTILADTGTLTADTAA